MAPLAVAGDTRRCQFRPWFVACVAAHLGMVWRDATFLVDLVATNVPSKNTTKPHDVYEGKKFQEARAVHLVKTLIKAKIQCPLVEFVKEYTSLLGGHPVGLPVVTKCLPPLWNISPRRYLVGIWERLGRLGKNLVFLVYAGWEIGNTPVIMVVVVTMMSPPLWRLQAKKTLEPSPHCFNSTCDLFL